MKPLYTLLILSLQLALSSSAFAQNKNFECSGKAYPSAKAQEVLSKVQSEYSSVDSMQASFTQEAFLSALDMTEGSQGQVWFKKPGKMKWHYTKPDEQVFIVNDSTLWLYQVNEKQVLIDQLTTVLLSDLPVSFLMGIGDLNRSFSLETACDGKEGIIVSLIPKNKDQQPEDQRGLQAFSLLVDNKTFLPKGAKVTDIAGNITAITLNGTTTNKGITDQTFVAHFPDGVDINDRRKQAVG